MSPGSLDLEAGAECPVLERDARPNKEDAGYPFPVGSRDSRDADSWGCLPQVRGEAKTAGVEG